MGLTFEKDRVILFARYTMVSVAISIFPEFLDKIEILNLNETFTITKNEIINNLTGSKIIFKGIKAGSGQQTANLKSIAGIDTLIIDEAEELIDETIFDKIDLSVRSNKHNNKIILLLNPITKSHWIYERFFEKKGIQPGSNISTDDTTYIHTTYLDIKNKLPDSFVKQLELMETENPIKYNHIVMGSWLDKAEGVIFKNWNIGDFPNIDYIFGMDYGFSTDPTTLIKVGIDKKNKKIYIDECLYKTGLVTTEIYEYIKDIVKRNLIIGDNSHGMLIEELKRKGLNIKPCIKGAGSIAEGIAFMLDYQLVITPNSTNFIKELNNYIWSDRNSEKPVDMYNHGIDASRYAIMNELRNVRKVFLKSY